MLNLKLIGVEIRVGARCAGREIKRELKLVPLEVTWPGELASQFGQATAEVTFHTSHGDVTLQAVLPQPSYDSGRAISGDDIGRAMARFEQSLSE